MANNFSMDDIQKKAQELVRAKQSSAANQTAVTASSNRSTASSQKWYSGEVPTGRETLAQIYKVSGNDTQKRTSLYNKYKAQTQDPTSVLYNPYTQATTTKQNTTNINNTNKALREWDDLSRELSFWATSSRNYSDDEIIANIDWKKYPTLAKMDAGRESGKPLALLTSVGYSKDAMHGVIWGARNPEQKSDNLEMDAVKSVLGRGNTYKRDENIAQRLNKASSTYAPYTVGGTMDDLMVKYGTETFDDKWLADNAYMKLDRDMADDYATIYYANQNTKELQQMAEEWKNDVLKDIERGVSLEAIFDEESFEEGYSKLYNLLESQRSGRLVNTTAAIDFDWEGMKKVAVDAYLKKNGTLSTTEYEQQMNDLTGGTHKQSDVDAEIENGWMLNTDILGKQDMTPAESRAFKAKASAGYSDVVFTAADGVANGTGGYAEMQRGLINEANALAGKNLLNVMRGLAEGNRNTLADFVPEQDLKALQEYFPEQYAEGRLPTQEEFNAKRAESSKDPSKEDFWFDFEAQIYSLWNTEAIVGQERDQTAQYQEQLAEIEDAVAEAYGGKDTDQYRAFFASYEYAWDIMNQPDTFDEYDAFQRAAMAEGFDTSKAGDYLLSYAGNAGSDVLKAQAALENAKKMGMDAEAITALEKDLSKKQKNLALVNAHYLTANKDYSSQVKAFDEAYNDGTVTAAAGKHSAEVLAAVVNPEVAQDFAIANRYGKPGQAGMYTALLETAELSMVMTGEERSNYKYLYATKGEEAATAYFDALSENLIVRKSMQDSEARQEWAGENVGNAILATAGSIAVSPVAALEGVVNTLSALFGKDLNPHKDFKVAMAQSDLRTGVKDGVAEAADNEIVSGIFNAVYDAVTSAGDTLVASATGGAWTMALSAMNSSMMDARMRGADTQQALAYGAANAVIELGTEKLGMDRIANAFKKQGAGGVRELLGEMLSGFANEFGEETVGNIAGQLTDDLIMGNLSNYNNAVQQYMDIGLSEEAAKAQAARDSLKEILYGGLVGGLSGGLTSGIGFVAGSVAGKNNPTEAPQKPVEAPVEQTPPVYQGTEKERAVSALSAAQGEGVGEVKQQATVQGVLQGLGVSAQESSAAAKMIMDNAGMKMAQWLIAKSDNPQDVAKALTFAQLVPQSRSAAVLMKKVNSNNAKAIGSELLEAYKVDSTDSKNVEQYETAVHESALADAAVEILEKEGSEAIAKANRDKKEREQEKREKTRDFHRKNAAAENAANALKEASAAVAQDASPENIKRQSEANKELQKAKSAREQARVAMEEANAKAKDAAEIEKNVVRNAQNSARMQAQQYVAQETEQRKAAEAEKAAKAEQERAAADVKRQDNNVTAMEVDEFISKMLPGDVVTDDVREKIAKMLQNRKASLQKNAGSEKAPGYDQKFIGQMQKKFNQKISVVDSTQGGKFLRYNGMYDAKTDTILIDQNATQSDVIYGVLLHELTHKAERSGTYKDFAKAILQIKYGGDEQKLAADIRAKQNSYNNRLKAMKALDSTVDATPLTADDASKEIVADLTREILFNDAESIRKLCGENPSVAKRVLETIKNFINKLRGVSDPALEQLNRARELFEEALGESTNTVADGGKQYQIIQLEDGRKLVAANRNVIKGDNPAEWAKQIQDYINTSIRQGKDVQVVADDGDILTLTKDTAWKAGSRNVIRQQDGKLRPYNDEEHRTKLSAEAHIDELAAVSTRGKGVVKDEKTHLFAKDGFNYRKAYFYDGDNYYEVTISVGLNKKKKTVYNIGRMVKKITPADLVGLWGSKAQGVIHDDSIAENEDTVKQEITTDSGKEVADVINGGATKQWSLASWTEEERQKVRDALVKSGYKNADVDKWISDVDGVASIISNDKARLDYTADPDQVMLKNNQEYVKTLDASTLCAKRLLYQGTFNEIQHLLPNTVITSDMLLDLLNMMKDAGYESPCGVCYVESRRRHLGKFAEQWLHGRPKTKEQKAWEPYNGDYIPTLDELTTTDGLNKLKAEHPQTYNDFMKKMASLGSSNPKIVELRTDYRGDIRKITKSQRDKIEKIGGLRVQSFSDFETPHLIDMMQAVLDMASKELTSQAYTKVPNFAWVFGDTGIKINLSLLAEGNGLDENGNLIFSSSEGMDFDEAMRLRERYSQNVGTIIVGANDAHIRAAMADPRIDYIIPFHRSGWGQNELKKVGVLQTYTDYQANQNERMLDGSKPEGGNFYPIDYWDYNKTGDENAATYLRMCEEDGRIPKFEQFLEKDSEGHWVAPSGYWKMLIDFKMYDNDGKGAPQQTVRPEFNMEEAVRVLNEYQGGADTLPVAQDIVERFVSEYKTSHPAQQYSLPSDNVLDEMIGNYLAEQEMADRQFTWNEEQKKSRFATQTGQNTNVLTPETKQKLLDDPYYTSTSQKKEIANAVNHIEKEGYQKRRDKMLYGETSMKTPSGQAEAYVLMKLAKESGDSEAEAALAFKVKESGTELAQSLAMRRLYTQMTPAGKLEYVQKAVDKINADYEARGKDTRVELPEWLAGALEKADGDSVATEQALDDAYREIAQQMPYSFKDWESTWRYLAMLGNPMTHAKNVIGNAVYMPYVAMRDTLTAAMQLTKSKEERTRTLAPIKKEYREFAKVITAAQRKLLTGESTATEKNALGKIDEYRQKGPKWMDKLSTINSEAMQNEDLFFKNRYFTRSLAGYLQAKGADLNNLSPEMLNSAIQFALDDAKKNTFNNINQFAQIISGWQRDSEQRGVGGKIASHAIDAILPFKNTPANVLARGIDFSPVGLVRTLTLDWYKYKHGKMTSTEFLDNLSAGVVGGMAMTGLGFLLASIGALHVDEDEVEGKQENSVDIFGQNITIDWMGTAAMPILMGGRMFQLWEDEGKQLIGEDFELTDIPNLITLFGSAMREITDPMINLSVLQGVKNFVESASYSGDNALSAMATKTATTYASQFVPSFFGAVARIADDTRRTTYTDKNSGVPSDMQYFGQSIRNKIPVLSWQSMAYMDAWGNDESNGPLWRRMLNNLLLPGYSRSIESPDEVEKMLADLYDTATEQNISGASDAKLKAEEKSFKVNGETYNMTAKEYEKMSKVRGQTAYDLLQKLMQQEEFYNGSDYYKVKAVGYVWYYANTIAKREINADYAPDSAKWVLTTKDPFASVMEKAASVAKTYENDQLRLALYDAIRDGRSDEIQMYQEALIENGVKEDSLKESITNELKAEYLTMYSEDQDAALGLEYSLRETGLFKTKDFNKWMKED